MKNGLIVGAFFGTIGFFSSLWAQEATRVAQASNEQPTLVSVQIINATIGPSRVDGSKWSGFGKIDSNSILKLSQLMLGTNPYASVAEALSGPIFSSAERPAPYGMVEVSINNEYVPNLRACLFPGCTQGIQRTFTPIFNLAAYQNVPLNDGTRFKITLYCKNHVTKPSPIGVAEINSIDLEKALAEQKVYQVSVADQTQNQLLFVGIEVRKVGGVSQ